MYDRYKDIEKRKAYNRAYQREYMKKRRKEGNLKKINLKDVPDEIRFVEKECKRHGRSIFALRSEGGYRCKKCSYEDFVKVRKNFKKRCVEYLGGKCLNCGYCKYIGALEFHHRDPLKKDFMISARAIKWEKAVSELDKCDLLCSNCHREVHAI